MDHPGISFLQSRAYIIGIDRYRHLPQLVSAVNDATELGRVLREVHGYAPVDVLVDDQATLAGLQHLLAERLPQEVGPEDRVLLYFAGHGLALRGSDGPTGYIAPQDGVADDVTTLLPMQTLYQALARLSCRHLLLILDCCFAGAFRWASVLTRDVGLLETPLYREQYERYLRRAAWQVLTSAAADERATDVQFGADTRGAAPHSPFAQQLYAALLGQAQVNPPPGDGVITANRLYSFLRDKLETSTEAGFRIQTPGLWPLPEDNNGEYIFIVPGKGTALQPAPPLDVDTNPYRGLEPFEKEHKHLFFGREALVDALTPRVVAQPLTVVVGASGAGKSSVVRAGLVPRLEELGWTVWGPVRPGTNPTRTLLHMEGLDDAEQPLAERVRNWRAGHPTARLALIVDQLEEVFTLCREPADREAFLQQIAALLEDAQAGLQVVVTLRSEFEPQFMGPDATLARFWQRFVVGGMTQNELRQAIAGPATARALVFEPESLVDDLVNELIQMPGALPLLSFTLSELYLRYLEHARVDDDLGRKRALNHDDYIALGRVAGALQQRAEREYQSADAATQGTMQRVLLRMVSLEGGARARRRVPLAELDYEDPAENGRVGAVLEKLTGARLVVRDTDAAGEAYVEPAHDALIQGWDRLWQWTREQQETLLVQRALTEAATDWLQRGRPSGSLWDNDPRLALLDPAARRRRTPGARLVQWAAAAVLPTSTRLANWLNRREAEFVLASRARQQVNRRLVLVTGIVLSLLIVVAVIAPYQADLNRQQAERQARRALAEALVAGADAQLTVDPERSILLAMEAISTTRSMQEPVLPLAEDALHRALLASHIRWTLRDNASDVSVVAWSPDGRAIATGSGSTVRVWNAETRQEQFALAPHRGTVTSAMWSPDGKQILTSADQDPFVHVSDGTTGKLLFSLLVNAAGVSVAAWSPDGHHILTLSTHPITETILGETALAAHGQTAAIWDVAAREVRVTLPKPLADVAWRPDGQAVASANDDGTVSTWDAASGRETLNPGVQAQLSITSTSSTGVAWSPDGHGLIVVRLGGGATILDLSGRRPPVTVGDTKTGILDATWSPNGQAVLTADLDGTARIWNGVTGQEQLVLYGHTAAVSRAAWRSDGRYILTGGSDQTARVWDVQPGEEGPPLRGNEGAILGLAYSPNGRFVASAGADGTMRIWDAQSGTALHTVPAGGPWSIAWSPAGQQIATGCTDGTVRIWDLVTAKEQTRYKIHSAQVENIAWRPDGQAILTASEDNTVKIWDLAAGRVRLTLTPHVLVVDAEWSPDGQRIVTAGGDTPVATARIWDVNNGHLAVTLTGHTGVVNHARWSPDGRQIVTTSDDTTARVWDVVTGQEAVVYRKHTARVDDVTWNPESRSQLVATAGADGTLQVWDTATGEAHLTLGGATNGVAAVAWSPDGSRLIAGGQDGVVRQYRMRVDDLLALAATRVTRSLTPEELTNFLIPGGATPGR